MRRGRRCGSVMLVAAALVAAAVPALASQPAWVVGLGLALCGLAAAIAVEDLLTMLIPDSLVAALALVSAGLLAAAVPDRQAFLDAVLAALAVAFGLFLFSAVYSRLRGMTVLGFGDVKLIGASALLVGPFGVGLQILLASTAALIFAGFRALRRGRRLRATMRLPFATFLAPALVIVWAWFLPPA